MKRFVLILTLVASLAVAQTKPEAPLQFQNPQEQQRFHELTLQLRCVMCQNQSLADSDAMIARDLRRVILKQMRAGQSDRQIKQYLVNRYSEFVLYQPPVREGTLLLWLGPALALLFGLFAIASIVKKRRALLPAAGQPQSDDQEW